MQINSIHETAWIVIDFHDCYKCSHKSTIMSFLACYWLLNTVWNMLKFLYSFVVTIDFANLFFCSYSYNHSYIIANSNETKDNGTKFSFVSVLRYYGAICREHQKRNWDTKNYLFLIWMHLVYSERWIH